MQVGLHLAQTLLLGVDFLSSIIGGGGDSDIVMARVQRYLKN